MKSKFQIITTKLSGGRFDDPPAPVAPQTKAFLKMFGVPDATIELLETGKVEDLNVLHKSSTEAIEKAVDARIRQSVVIDEKGQISVGVWNRAEEKIAALLKPYGFDAAVDLKDVDEKGRFNKMIEIGQTKLSTHVSELNEKIKGKGPDSAKLTQLESQLTKANADLVEYKAKVEGIPNQIAAAQTLVRDENDIKSGLYDVLNGYGKDDKPKLRMSHGNVEALLNTELQSRGLKVAVKRDDNGKVVSYVPVKAETGEEIAIGNTSTNHTLQTFIDEVGTTREFFAASNGNEGNGKPFANFAEKDFQEKAKNIHPAALAAMKEDE